MAKALVLVKYGKDGRELSTKAAFVVRLFTANSALELFYVLRRTDLRFKEEWQKDQVELATSALGLFVYFVKAFLKNPRDLRDEVLPRLFHNGRSYMTINEGFLSAFSNVLHDRFVTSSRTDSLIRFLDRIDPPKIFLIDEFDSAKLVSLETLKRKGSIVYVSQDVAYDHYRFASNSFAKKLMYEFERKAVSFADVVVACSERDRLKYLQMGAKKAVFYPNIYPCPEFEPDCKNEEPSVSIVLSRSWGPRVISTLEEILNSLACVDKNIKVYLIGIRPQRMPGKVNVQHYEFIPSKKDYLRTLSKSWVGINVGIHLAGTNERKYDYAIAGLVVLSDNFGSRGDLLPHEYTYVDYHDLAAKLSQLLNLGKDKLAKMGLQNREQALFLAEMQKQVVLTAISGITSGDN